MKWFIYHLLFVSTFFCNSQDQTNKELAHSKKDKAVYLMDNGQPDEAIQLLEEAKKLDPGTYIYDYEIGYAFNVKHDYKNSLKTYLKVIEYDDVNSQCYQMLGNLYDINGEPEKAIEIYEKGLKKFPKAGRLYLEKGNVFWNQKKYGEGLPFYEEGIKVEPTFPSNYYRAALVYCNSDDPVWGIMYGEIFLNLERKTKRTDEISKLLFETYSLHIKIASDTISTSLHKNVIITTKPKKLKNDLAAFFKNFGVIYEKNMVLSCTAEKQIDIHSLDRIRTRFIENYFSPDEKNNPQNVLFDFQKSMKEGGYFEAYNYWVLSKGHESEFNEWQKDNPEKWAGFLIWFHEHSLNLNEDNAFHSSLN